MSPRRERQGVGWSRAKSQSMLRMTRSGMRRTICGMGLPLDRWMVSSLMLTTCRMTES